MYVRMYVYTCMCIKTENCTDKHCTYTPKNTLSVKHTIISKIRLTLDCEWGYNLLTIHEMF